MNILVFGANGVIGQRIVNEALARGHQVTAVVRTASAFPTPAARLKVTEGEALDPAGVAAAAAGHDVVISALGPGMKQSPEMLVQAASALVDGVKRAGVRRLLVVGGAGSLLVAPGLQVMDTPSFPAAWRPTAQAHRDALDVYRQSDLDWTVLSPAGMIQPGERTGKYRTALEDLLVDANGNSSISCEDYAVALLDEVEKPAHLRQRFTAAY